MEYSESGPPHTLLELEAVLLTVLDEAALPGATDDAVEEDAAEEGAVEETAVQALAQDAISPKAVWPAGQKPFVL